MQECSFRKDCVESTWVSEEYIQAQNFFFVHSTPVYQKDGDSEILTY